MQVLKELNETLIKLNEVKQCYDKKCEQNLFNVSSTLAKLFM